MSDINVNAQLEELFPELQGLLDNWETAPQANGNGFENEAGITPSEIEQALQQRMSSMPQFQSGQTAPAPPASHVEDGGPPAPQSAPQPVPQPTPQQTPAAPPVEPVQPGAGQPGAPAVPPQPAQPQADETLVVGQDENGQDIRISRDAALRYYQFDNDFQSDPALRQRILDYYQGRSTGQEVQPLAAQPPVPTPVPTPQAIPEELDLSDPTISFLVQQQQQLGEQIRMLAGGVQDTRQQFDQRQQAENDGLIRRAMTSFSKDHSLTDEQMVDLRTTAARLNVLPALMQGVDPITGAPSKPDPLTALERSFEIAMMMTPQYRQQEFSREIQRRVTDSRRKQKLAGLAGSSGSVPRTTPAPTTEQGRRQAMIDEIRQMQDGGWSPPES